MLPDTASTVVEESGQTVLETEPGRPATTATEAPASQGQATQLPAFMKGHISPETWQALPEAARQQFQQYGKSLYGDYQKKTTELSRVKERMAPFLSMVEDLEQNQDLRTKMEQAYHAAKAGVPTSVSQAQSQAKAILDGWMDQATDPAQREQLRQLREAIKQETNVEELRKELADLKIWAKQVASNAQVSRQEQLTMDLRKLPEAYQALVEKYDAGLLKLGGQYPTLSPKKLLQLVATDEEYEQAVKTESAKQTTKHVTRIKEAAVAQPSQTTGANEVTVSKIPSKSPWYGARHNLREAIDRILPEIRANPPAA